MTLLKVSACTREGVSRRFSPYLSGEEEPDLELHCYWVLLRPSEELSHLHKFTAADFSAVWAALSFLDAVNTEPAYCFNLHVCLCCRFTSTAAHTPRAWLSSSLSPSSRWIWAAQGRAWTSCVRNGRSTSSRLKSTYRVCVWIQEATHPRAADGTVTLMFWLNCTLLHCYFTPEMRIYSTIASIIHGVYLKLQVFSV